MSYAARARACEDVYVIKVSHYKVSGRKLVLNLLEGGGKGDTEEPRHEGIPLLPALGTGHNMRGPGIVCPNSL